MGFRGCRPPTRRGPTYRSIDAGLDSGGVVASEDAGDRGAGEWMLCRSRVSSRGWFPGVGEPSPGPGEVGTGPGGVVWVSRALVALVGAAARAPGALGITSPPRVGPSGPRLSSWPSEPSVPSSSDSKMTPRGVFRVMTRVSGVRAPRPCTPLRTGGGATGGVVDGFGKPWRSLLVGTGWQGVGGHVSASQPSWSILRYPEEGHAPRKCGCGLPGRRGSTLMLSEMW